MVTCRVCNSLKTSKFWSGKTEEHIACSFSCACVQFYGFFFQLGLVLFVFSIFMYKATSGNVLIILFFGVPAVFFLVSSLLGFKNRRNEQEDNFLIYNSDNVERNTGNNDNHDSGKDHNRLPLLEEVHTIHVEELGENYRGCCYQTARLGERYCVCERAVDERLIEFLK